MARRRRDEADRARRAVGHPDVGDVRSGLLIAGEVRHRERARRDPASPAAVRRGVGGDEVVVLAHVLPVGCDRQEVEARCAVERGLGPGERQHARREARGHAGRLTSDERRPVPAEELEPAVVEVLHESLVAIVAGAWIRVEIEPEVDPTVGRKRLVVRDRRGDREVPVRGLRDGHRGDVRRGIVVAGRVGVRRGRERDAGDDEERHGGRDAREQLHRGPRTTREFGHGAHCPASPQETLNARGGATGRRSGRTSGYRARGADGDRPAEQRPGAAHRKAEPALGGAATEPAGTAQPPSRDRSRARHRARADDTVGVEPPDDDPERDCPTRSGRGRGRDRAGPEHERARVGEAIRVEALEVVRRGVERLDLALELLPLALARPDEIGAHDAEADRGRAVEQPSRHRERQHAVRMRPGDAVPAQDGLEQASLLAIDLDRPRSAQVADEERVVSIGRPRRPIPIPISLSEGSVA